MNSRPGNDFRASRAGKSQAGAVAMERKSGKSHMRLMFALLVILVMLCLYAVQVSAQENEAAANAAYKSVPMHEGFAKEGMEASVIAAAKSYCAGGNTNVNLVQAYFRRYVPAKMTGPDAMKELTPLMKDVNTLLARSQRSKPYLGKAVADILLPPMTALAKGNYHPAARINAALVLGRLDSTPADAAGRVPPTPYMAALQPLVEVYRDETNVDGLRVAALLGLQRQVGLGFKQIPPAGKVQLRTMMTELLDSKTPVNRTDKVHAYVQRYAVDILQQLGSSEDDGKQLGVKLIGISTAPEKQELIALYSASKIGALGGSLKGQVDKPEDVLERWARLAHDAFQSEVQRLNSIERAPPTQNQPVKPEDVLQPKESKSKTGGSGGPDMGEGDDGELGMGGEMGGMELGAGYDESPDAGMEDDAFGGMGGMGFGGQTTEYKDQPAEVLGSRRYLNKVLQQLNMGATGSRSKGVPKNGGGLMLCVEEAKANVVKDWVVKLEEVITALNSEALDDRTKFLEGLDEQVIVLAELANVESGEGNQAKPADEEEFSMEDDVLDAPKNPAPGNTAAPGTPAAGGAEAPGIPAGPGGAEAPGIPAGPGGAAAPGTPSPDSPATPAS
ncbi:hypothetical protein N9B17_00120 [Rhodopirellula sp.]|nr:hypothetical protein [Rhodopirellula sp.]MDB4770857.1 hypothetical protein [bacterium]